MALSQGLVLEVSDTPALSNDLPKMLPFLGRRLIQLDFWGVRVMLMRLGLGMPEQRTAGEFSPEIFCLLLKTFTYVFSQFSLLWIPFFEFPFQDFYFLLALLESRIEFKGLLVILESKLLLSCPNEGVS